MGLLEGESWEDYLGVEVFVTSESGKDGFRGVCKDYSDEYVLVQDESGDLHEVEAKWVYGLWILEDW
jgi:hypothetical protein